MRCRSSWPSSTARCSRACTGSKRSRSDISTCSVRGRIRDRRIRRHLVVSTALLEGRQPTIYGDGEQTRDFTYVANVVDGVLRACEAPKAAGEVINVACGTRISLNDLLARDEQDRRSEHPTNLHGRARGRRARFAGRHHEGENAARYEPKVLLEEGLRHTLDWCRDDASAAAGR